MFTGIIEACVPVAGVTTQGGILRLTLDLDDLAQGVAIGDSISVSGVCLTAVQIQTGRLTFDISEESARLTTLAELRHGDKVNVERSLKIGDRLGGHFLQGHVDGVGQIIRKDESPGQCTIGLRVPSDLSTQMILKGSVAVDGISLTISKLDGPTFEVAVIPHTLANTTLGLKRVGDRVNIETDLIGKWVAKLIGNFKGADGSMGRLLEEHGFK